MAATKELDCHAGAEMHHLDEFCKRTFCNCENGAPARPTCAKMSVIRARLFTKKPGGGARARAQNENFRPKNNGASNCIRTIPRTHAAR